MSFILFLVGLFVGAVAAGVLAVLYVLSQRQALRDLSEKLLKQEVALSGKSKQLEEREAKVNAQAQELEARDRKVTDREVETNSHVISYEEMKNENAILKRDLQNVDVNLHKLEMDRDLQARKQAKLDERSQELAKRYLGETIKAVVQAVGSNNFAACKQRLVNAIIWSREIGFEVSAEREAELLAELRAEFEKAVRAAFEREEQARIKAQIREEQKLQKEVERELKQLDRERAAIQAALDRALAEAADKHGDEVKRLQERLAEAEAKAARAVSMAQQTKAGNVYVISNIGAFGEGVYKVGMTRRLEPLERIKELGDASVPFPFDVHMMISCDDAPGLENTLHRELHKLRLNKTNPRKEFFRADLEKIAEIVRKNHGEIQYVADPEALEYRQSLTMSEEDSEFIESVYDAVDDEEAASTPDDV